MDSVVDGAVDEVTAAAAVAGLDGDSRQEGRGLATFDPLYHAFIDASPDAVLIVEEGSSRFSLANRAAERLLGYSQRELLDLGPAGITAPQDVPRLARAETELRERGEWRGEWRLQRREGCVVTTEATTTRLTYGQRVLYQGIFRDITERQRMEEALQESEERLTRLVQAITDGIIIVSLEGRVTFANAAAEAILGVTRGSLTGRPLSDPSWEITTADARPSDVAAQPFLRVARSGQPEYGLEGTVNRPDGSRVILSINCVALRDVRGDVVGVVGSLHDVTAERGLQRTKDELVSVVSHELRTPLTSLVGFAELLLTRDFTEPQRRQCLTVMLQEGQRLTNLINDFLDVQRVESSGASLNLRPAALRPLLQWAVATAREDPDCPITVALPNDLPPVLADPDRVKQVLANLLSNAQKYSPAGGTVRVAARVVDGAVEVSVRDQGLGLPADAISRLFEKFYRVDNSDRRTIQGSGLGLSVCRKIVEAHGGRIWAHSEGLGRGSTFCFTLPVADGDGFTGEQEGI